VAGAWGLVNILYVQRRADIRFNIVNIFKESINICIDGICLLFRL